MLEPREGARAILFICDFNAHGGTQTHLLHLFESLDRSRFHPALATLNLHPDLARRLKELKVEVTNLELKGAFRPRTFRSTGALAAFARRSQAALLHGCLFQGNILTAAVSALSGVPCITSVRNVDLWKRRRHRLASAAAHRRARRVVFNSVAVRDRTAALEMIPGRKSVVIHNGVRDAAAAPPTETPGLAGLLEPGRPTAVCVASLRPKKGHAHLLDAFARVVRRVPSARLLLLGEGPLAGSLRAQVERAGLREAVVFAGYSPDVGAALRLGDLFVLASLEEGMPNALLEAMSASLACVVTDVGGNAEAVEEGRTGYLVPPADAEAMAARLAELLADRALRRRMGEAARSSYEERFTIARMTAAYERLYDEVLAG